MARVSRYAHRPGLGVPFVDDFARADGPLGNGWIFKSGVWQISGGKAVATPTLGAELVTDPGLEATYTAGLCNTLSKVGSPTVSQSADVHGGSKAQQFTATAQYDLVQYSYASHVVGSWYQYSGWGKRTAGTSGNVKWRVGNNQYGAITNATYTQFVATERAAATTNQLRVNDVGASGFDTVIVDDLSLKALTLFDQFATIPFGSSDPTLQVGVTRVAGCQAGCVLNLNNPDNPTDFVFVYEAGAGSVKLEKCVTGVYTPVITGAVAYGAGKVLKVVKAGSLYTLFYDGIQVGMPTAINEPSIVFNSYHGLFSMNPGNSLDNFSVVW